MMNTKNKRARFNPANHLNTFLALVLVSVASNVAAEDELSIVITINGAAPNTGNAVISLFDSEENFLEKPIVSLSKKINERGSARFELSGVSDSHYSISAFHDLDSNGELDTNFIGIPSEPVGFSRNAKGSFGPPSFEDTKFKPSTMPHIEINLLTVGE